MKAVNKVRLIYLPAIILPIFVMIVSILALGFGYVRINNTDISADGFERFVNPLKTMNNSTKEIYRELEEKILTEPSALEDKGYLEDVNRRLSEKDSYLLLQRDAVSIPQARSAFRPAGNSLSGRHLTHEDLLCIQI